MNPLATAPLRKLIFLMCLSVCVIPEIQGQATQLIFNDVPINAGLNLPVYIDVCAADGSNVIDPTYTTPIEVQNNGGTLVIVEPSFSEIPDDGCVRFKITPFFSGVLNLRFTSGTFADISTGPITVSNYDIPTTEFVGEIFNDPSNVAAQRALADTLNDAWERRIGDSCNNVTPFSFEPVFGDMTYDGTAGVGTITNLFELIPGTAGQPYTGTVEFRVVNMKGPDEAPIQGEPQVGGMTFLSGSNFLQDSAPMPLSLIPTNNTRFTEITGDFNSQNGIRFSFNPPINQFGAWFGDVESNIGGNTPGELVLFYDDVELKREDIPTRSSALQQSNAPQDCGDYPGCGNEGTIWIEYYGAPVTDMLVIVGDDNTSGLGGFGGTEHLSFVGPTIGGSCLNAPLDILDLALSGEYADGKIGLNWSYAEETTHMVYQIEQSRDGQNFIPLDLLRANRSPQYFYSTSQEKIGTHYYRLRLRDMTGNVGFSSTIRIEVQPGAKLSFSGLAYVNESVLIARISSPRQGMGSCLLMDIHGRKVYETSMEMQVGFQELSMQLPPLASGPHILLIKQGGDMIRQKMVVR